MQRGFALGRRHFRSILSNAARGDAGQPIGLELFREHLQRSGLDAALKDERVAIACSGGPDSMALAALWRQHLPASAEATAFVVDHRLRAESTAEAELVRGRLQRLGYDAHVLTCAWPAADTAARGGAEAGAPVVADTRLLNLARERRYALLSEACRRRAIGALLVAHHRDDQAETFHYRLGLNSGLLGLAAMRPLSLCVPAGPPNDIAVARPLLRVRKRDLLATCAALQLPYVADPSNASLRFQRNAIRAVLRELEEDVVEAGDTIDGKDGNNGNDQVLAGDAKLQVSDGSNDPNAGNTASAIGPEGVATMIEFLGRHRRFVETTVGALLRKHAMLDRDLGAAFIVLDGGGSSDRSWFVQQRPFALHLLGVLVAWTSPNKAHLRHARVLRVYNDICAHLAGRAPFRTCSVMRSVIVPPARGGSSGAWTICREPLTRPDARERPLAPAQDPPVLWDGRFRVSLRCTLQSGPSGDVDETRAMSEALFRQLVAEGRAREAFLRTPREQSTIPDDISLSAGRFLVRPLEQADIHFVQRALRPVTTRTHQMALRHFLKTMPVMARFTVPVVAWEGVTSANVVLRALVSIPTLGINLRPAVAEAAAENVGRLHIEDIE